MLVSTMDQHAGPPPRPKKPPTPASWRPGQSGNPRGRPPKGNALTEAVRAKVDTAELVDIALDLARNGEAESTRLQALAWLRDSGYTRPAERHEVGPVGATDAHDDVDYDALSVDQLRELDRAEREYEARRAAVLGVEAPEGALLASRFG
jgi:hypothetical protein